LSETFKHFLRTTVEYELTTTGRGSGPGAKAAAASFQKAVDSVSDPACDQTMLTCYHACLLARLLNDSSKYPRTPGGLTKIA